MPKLYDESIPNKPDICQEFGIDFSVMRKIMIREGIGLLDLLDMDDEEIILLKLKYA